ncbi:pilus assembly protein TadG-related protein [Bradyrhizobium glycinis]|uniref:pilus assembly protein TadG-related protein n=1 Tax=Bradyrhizobium glycinis TaxID=2751812 RepID=UPI0018DA32B5|nr:pilus assembly protein TadG-related protein [Bradyrhizobium glycinis]MBH5369044.1 pilus assembly protein TadG [Bradyrhizobium glycinis]
MRNLRGCRRGSVAFATVIALVPLVGVIALGAEAGSWYVTKQHAQSAADAAAYSGGLTLACTISGSSNCDTDQDYVYRGKQFAAQNSFCNSGDSFAGCALPAGTVRTVEIDRGSYSVGAWASSASGSFVRSVVTQQQPTYLAGVLGLSTANIRAQAIVEIQNPKDLCALGLSPNSIGLTLGGSVNITGNGCGLMANNTVKYASTPTFSGSGWAVNAVNGCTNSGNCDPGVPYNYNMLPATNPLAPLNTASFNSRTGNTAPLQKITCAAGLPSDVKNCYKITPNSSGTGAYKDLTVTTGDYVTFDTQGATSGTYFFYKASIKINGGYVNCTCTNSGTGVTLVLLGDSSISISGATVSLSAPATNSFSSLLNGVLIDDQAPTKSNNNVTINGSGNVALGGALYFPNVDVTWNGTTASTNTTCTEVIANTLTMSGSAYLSTSGCAPGTIAKTQVVALVK